MMLKIQPLLLLLLSQAPPLVKCSSNNYATNSAAGSGGGVYGGRHSYSLSTFSPSGELDQVVRAMRASMLGVPIVALAIPPSSLSESSVDGGSTIAMSDNDGASDDGQVVESNVASETSMQQRSDKTTIPPLPSNNNPLSSQGGIYLSIPLRFLTTSPLVRDDGTPRIVQLTSALCVTHTGVGADGRALCDIAVKIALDYRYIYGEEISVEELLEGLAEKVQEMTMKGGSRPFGCALLVGWLGRSDDCDTNYDDGYGSGGRPAMYRVDPSGAVSLLNSDDDIDGDDGSIITNREGTINSVINKGRRGSVAFLGKWDALRQKKDDIRNQLENQQFASERGVQDSLIDAARQTYIDDSPLSQEKFTQSAASRRSNQPILFASFTRERGLQISHIMNSYR